MMKAARTFTGMVLVCLGIAGGSHAGSSDPGASPLARTDFGPVPAAAGAAKAALGFVDAFVNPGGATELFYAGQGGAEVIEDVHADLGGPYTQVSFEVYEPTAASTFDAEVWIYDNPFGADNDRIVLAGPFAATGLASGRQLVAIDLAVPVAGGPDLWIGVRFTSPTAGLLINETPTVGTSHDLYAEGGRLYWFGGSPVANFAISLRKGTAVSDVPSREPATNLVRATPNPFNPRTRIEYTVPNDSPVSLTVFNVRGQAVRHLLVTAERPAGVYGEFWNGRDDSGAECVSGVYLLRFQAGPVVATNSVVLVR